MKTLREMNPGATEMWAYDLNGDMTPDNVSVFSEEEAWFRCCDNPKHLFKKPIKKMTSYRDGHNVGCKYCGPNAKEAFPGETDFFTKVPEAVELWDFTQNNSLGLEPTKLLPSSDKKAHFVCNNGHDEYRKISYFSKSPYCQICQKSLLVNAPKTPLFLNEKFNTTESIKDYIKSDTRTIELACPNCYYTWSWRGGLWGQRQYCPHCGYDGTEGSCERNAFVSEMYHIVTLRDTNPEMAAMWDYEENGDATPDNTREHSNEKYAFKCDNGHKFKIDLGKLYNKDGNTSSCPFCKGVTRLVLEGTNDLTTMIPEIADFWDYENNDVLPSTLTKGSGYKANFKCSKGHSFRRKVYQFSLDPKCPECRTIENTQKYSIKNLRPESYKFWDFEKNTLDPSLTSAYLNEDAFWKCPDCGYEWVQRISTRCASRGGKCPSHDLKRVFSEEFGLKYNDSFLYKNPDASKFWNIKLSNGLCPENTPKYSTKEIYMNCSRGKHKPYRIKVCNIKKPPYGCPECIKEDAEESYKKYSLKFNVPCAVDMWDYTNNGMSIDDAKIYMIESANFVCREGHCFSRSLRIFAKNQDCPICGMNTVVKYPHLVKQWNFKKNKGYDINLISANSKEVVWWRCKKCGYEWQTQILSRKQSAGHCPCCEERTVVVKGITDLFSVIPDIKRFYDFETNKDINPDELSVASQTHVNWKCDTCGYKWCTSVATRITTENGVYKVKSCPACTGQVRTKSYGEEYPDLAKRFADELNNCSLYDIVEYKYSVKLYYWYCDRCDEIFESTIDIMVNARNSEFKGCSYCAGKKVKRENSFAALHPEVMDEFSLDNEMDPYTVTEKSRKNVKWICRNNPKHTWKTTFNARANGQGGCAICRDYNYAITFAELFPEYEKYYDKSKNNRPFHSLAAKSNDTVWWICDKGHSFLRSVCYLNVAGKFRCPVCTGRTIVAGENDLMSEYPELYDIWDYAKNEADPTMLSPKANVKYNFTCSKGHSYATYLNTLIDHNFRCFVCDNVIVQEGVNSLLDTNFELCREISENEPRKSTEFIKSSAYSMLWKCPECSGEYHAEIREREVGDDSCPYCNGRRTQFGINSLIDTHQLLAAEFSPENNCTAGKIRKNSKKWVKWICPDCNGTYSKQVCEREVGDDSCPYCRNEQLLYGFNGVAQTESLAIKEWADTDIDPNSIMATSRIRIDWECEKCGGIYREPLNKHIQDFHNNVHNCPYCNNRKPLAGYNTLKVKCKRLMEEWNYRSNYLIVDPDTILPTYTDEVWWTCECGKSYKMSPQKRLYYQKRNIKSCPYCKGRRRKKYRHF